MASEPIQAARSKTAQPDADTTRKSQKAYQVSDTFNAKEVNDEFDRLHERLNQIVVEAASLADLVTDGTATNAQICTRINALYAVLRQAGLFRSG